MHNQNPWDFLRRGDKDPGLDILRGRCEQDPTASHIMELGVAYLWLGDYRAVEQHFQKAIKTYPALGDSFYGMAGAARWCAGDPAAAVKYWRDGLDAPYAGAAGLGVRLPLLLFVASILNPPVFPKKRAEEILLNKSKDPRAARWPGSLAKYVLGQDSNVERVMDFKLWPVSALDEVERKRREGADRKSREWLVAFYRSLLELDTSRMSPTQFREFTRAATDASKPDFSNEHYFLSLMWNEEFFIARREASS